MDKAEWRIGCGLLVTRMLFLCAGSPIGSGTFFRPIGADQQRQADWFSGSLSLHHKENIHPTKVVDKQKKAGRPACSSTKQLSVSEASLSPSPFWEW
jgi:hypothetical protein